MVDPHKPNCPDPIKNHDCDRENTTIDLLSELKADCEQRIIIPLKEGTNKTKLEINITLPKDAKPEKLDFYILHDGIFNTGITEFNKVVPSMLNTIKGLAPDVRIGFGTFFDKNDKFVSRSQIG